MGSGKYDSWRPPTNHQATKRDDEIEKYQKHNGSNPSADVDLQHRHDRLAINGRAAHENRQDPHKEPDDRRAGDSSGIKPPRLDLSAPDRKNIMMSPSESPHKKVFPSSSAKSISQPPTPASATMFSSSSNPAFDIQSSIQTFMDSIIATAVEQVRYEDLKREEQHQLEEQTRWSGYSANFLPLSEEQSYTMKDIQNTMERSQKCLTQARQKGENVAQGIAKCLVATSRAPDVDIDILIKRLENRVNDQSEEIRILTRENGTLKDSAVDAKSRYHQVEKIFRRQGEELTRLKARYDQKISDVVAQSKAFTDFTSRQDQINKDVSRSLESYAGMKSELQKVKDSQDMSESGHEATLASLKEVRDDLKSSKQDRILLQEVKNQTQETANDLEKRIQQISDTQSAEKSALELLEKQSVEVTSAMAQSSRDRQELSDQSEKFKIRLSSMEQMQHDKAGSQSDVASCIEENRLLREEQQAQKAQLELVVRDLEEYKHGQPVGTSNLRTADDQTITRREYDTLCEQRDEAINDDVEAINKRIDEMDGVIKGSLGAMDKANKTANDQGVVLTDYEGRLHKYEENQVRLSKDHSATTESLNHIRTQILEFESKITILEQYKTTAHTGKGDQQSVNDHFRSELSDLGGRLDSFIQEFRQRSPPSPPPCCVKEEVQPQVGALSIEVQSLRNCENNLTDKIRAVEGFQATWESRWNNLTTEPLVSGILFHLQRPLYTINTLQTDVNQLRQLLGQHDARMNQLSDSIKKVAQDVGTFQKVVEETRNHSNTAVAAVTANKRWMQESMERHDARLRENNENTRQALSTVRDMKDEMERIKASHDLAMANIRKSEEKATSDETKLQAYDATLAEFKSEIKSELLFARTEHDAVMAVKPAIDEKLQSMERTYEDIKAIEQKISRQLEEVIANRKAVETAKSEVEEHKHSALTIYNAILAVRKEIDEMLNEIRAKHAALVNRDLNGKGDQPQTRPDTPNVAIQNVNSRVHNLQTSMNGEILGLRAEIEKIREEFSTVHEEMQAERRNSFQKAEAMNRSIEGDDQRKNVNFPVDASKAQDEDSDSDAPIIHRGKRSYAQISISDSAKKKRRINPPSDDESYNERSTPKSSQSKKKSESINGHADKPSPNKRGRPRKTAPMD